MLPADMKAAAAKKKPAVKRKADGEGDTGAADQQAAEVQAPV